MSWTKNLLSREPSSHAYTITETAMLQALPLSAVAHFSFRGKQGITLQSYTGHFIATPNACG